MGRISLIEDASQAFVQVVRVVIIRDDHRDLQRARRMILVMVPEYLDELSAEWRSRGLECLGPFVRIGLDELNAVGSESPLALRDLGCQPCRRDGEAPSEGPCHAVPDQFVAGRARRYRLNDPGDDRDAVVRERIEELGLAAVLTTATPWHVDLRMRAASASGAGPRLNSSPWRSAISSVGTIFAKASDSST